MTQTDTAKPFHITLPDLCVVILVGASGSGKSTFAAKHFLPTETLSSDYFRGVVSDDENLMDATVDAFAALHYLAEIRLRNRKLVVVDATNVQETARKPLLDLAFKHDCLCVAIVLDVSDAICYERNRGRANRTFGPNVIATHRRQLKQSLRTLRREGFRYIHILSPEQIENLVIEREPLWTDRRKETGKFDIIGDVHGCYDELTELLGKLGYVENSETKTLAHPEGRRAFFVGDLVDRGPQSVEVVELVQAMIKTGSAFCVPGNHDMRLAKKLNGKEVRETHGLSETLEQIEALPDEKKVAFKKDFVTFADTLVSHFWLDGGALCIAHAGMKQEYIGRASGRVRDFALFGETTGETDEYGLPIRYNWAEEYRGKTTVVYGHTPIPEPDWLNNTLNLDTGCVFGGKLSCLRWPEREIVQVAAKQTYAEPIRPISKPEMLNSEEVHRETPTQEATPDPELLAYILDTTTLIQESSGRLRSVTIHLAQLAGEHSEAERIIHHLTSKSEEAASGGNSELAVMFKGEIETYTSRLQIALERKLNLDTVHASMQGSLDQLKTRLKSACDATDSPFPDFSNEPISDEELFEEPSIVQKIADLEEQLDRKQTLGEKTRSILGRLFSPSRKTELSSDEILMG